MIYFFANTNLDKYEVKKILKVQLVDERDRTNSKNEYIHNVTYNCYQLKYVLFIKIEPNKGGNH